MIAFGKLNLFLCVLLIASAVSISSSGLTAQVRPQALSLGGEVGPSIYFGEFNSLEGTFEPFLGYEAGLLLTYNLTSWLSIGGSASIAGLGYNISDFARNKYSSNFFGPDTATLYPGTSVRITDQNCIELSKLAFFAQVHFDLGTKLSPYAMFGIGTVDFSATNENGNPLPTNITGEYNMNPIVFPLGAGLRYPFNEWLSGHAQILFNFNSNDYLDGYAHFVDFGTGNIASGPGVDPTRNDHFMTVSFGLSAILYAPQVEAPPPPPVAANEPPPSEQPSPAEPAPQKPAPKPLPQVEGPDSDGDGLSDEAETNRFMTDPSDPDTDRDNLSDANEVYRYNTSPNNPDTDEDGLTDGEEAIVYGTDPLDYDTDGDVLDDREEVQDHRTDPLDVDTDDDLLGDGVEVEQSLTDPLNPDTDGDGVIDGLDNCPLIPGDPANRGCPYGTPSSADAMALGDVPVEFGEASERVEFSNIFFRVNTDDFDFTKPETARNLQSLRNFLEDCDDVGVLIEGHTSSEGNSRWNRQLSYMRANRVRNWLIANGVAPNKVLGTIGYGSDLPKVREPAPSEVPPDVLEEVRSRNRRITALVRKPCR